MRSRPAFTFAGSNKVLSIPTVMFSTARGFKVARLSLAKRPPGGLFTLNTGRNVHAKHGSILNFLHMGRTRARNQHKPVSRGFGNRSIEDSHVKMLGASALYSHVLAFAPTLPTDATSQTAHRYIDRKRTKALPQWQGF
jgi:hypothetical protein